MRTLMILFALCATLSAGCAPHAGQFRETSHEMLWRQKEPESKNDQAMERPRRKPIIPGQFRAENPGKVPQD